MQRRELLGRLSQIFGLFALGGFVPAAAATALERTPSQTAGPFYPLRKPRELDQDLLRRGGGKSLAGGEPLQLSGRVVDTGGRPIDGAVIEIWQSDHRGIYDHPHAPGRESFDVNFQGYGETRSGPDGRYRFLTIVPVPYTGRPPHIHVKVNASGLAPLTTQLYIKDHAENDRDFILTRLLFGNRDRLMMVLRPAKLADGLEGKATAFDFVV